MLRLDWKNERGNIMSHSYEMKKKIVFGYSIEKE